jgi:hypothetical protein
LASRSPPEPRNENKILVAARITATKPGAERKRGGSKCGLLNDSTLNRFETTQYLQYPWYFCIGASLVRYGNFIVAPGIPMVYFSL